jgi:hypothetical protein
VISPAGDTRLTATPAGHLAHGTSRLAQPLQATLSHDVWDDPANTTPVTITFAQRIGASEVLRTGDYATPVTITLGITTP